MCKVELTQCGLRARRCGDHDAQAGGILRESADASPRCSLPFACPVVDVQEPRAAAQVAAPDEHAARPGQAQRMCQVVAGQVSMQSSAAMTGVRTTTRRRPAASTMLRRHLALAALLLYFRD